MRSAHNVGLLVPNGPRMTDAIEGARRGVGIVTP